MSELGSLLSFELGDASPIAGAKMRYEVDFGSANTGGAPTFTTYQRNDTFEAMTPPVLTEIPGKPGAYYWDVDWKITTATSISYRATLNGIELSDVISAPNVAVPGTTAATAGISSLSGYETVGAIIGKVAVEARIAALSPAEIAAFDPFASTDANVILLLRLLDDVGRDLSTEVKAHLQGQFAIVIQADTYSYALPADYGESVDETLWDRPGMLPLVGPVSPQDEAYLKSSGVPQTVLQPFRLQGNLITFPTLPAVGTTYYGFYYRRSWVQTEGSGTGPDSDHITAASDYVLHDSELVIRALKLRFLEEKGHDTAAAEKRYASRLQWVKGATVGGRTLSLNRTSGFRFIDTNNLPATGWGQA